MNQFGEILRDESLPTSVLNKIMVSHIDSQELFDELFAYAYDSNKHVASRVFSVVEKLTLKDAAYIQSHKEEVLSFCKQVKDIMVKYHLPLIVSKFILSEEELGEIWSLLTYWAIDKQEGRSVRSNSIHGLYNLLSQCSELEQDFHQTISVIKEEDIPALQARVRKLKL